MKGLIIRQPWVDLILSGKKTWEIRGSNTKIRGSIAIIQSGTGLIVGTAELVDTKKLSDAECEAGEAFHCIKDKDILQYKNPYAWVLQNAKHLEQPIPYEHPQGAVIWVNLS